MFYQWVYVERNTFKVIAVLSKHATGNGKRSVMTIHVQINNNKTYLQTFIPTGIKTKFNTCEMYLIARSGLFQSLVIRVTFLYCNNPMASIRSILKSLHLVDLYRKTEKLYRYFNFHS